MFHVPFRSPVLKEYFLFFKRWIGRPLQLGAAFPSSRALSRLMAEGVMQEWGENEPGCVIELGAGTGSFSQALLDAGLPPRFLVCIEIDPKLCDYLRARFPEVSVIQGSATALSSLIPKDLHGNVPFIVSGLPMLILPPATQQRIIKESLLILEKKGCLFQFTYSPFSSIAAPQYDLKKKRVGITFRNIPPATVWRYEKDKHYAVR